MSEISSINALVYDVGSIPMSRFPLLVQPTLGQAESLKLERRDKSHVLRDACQMMREHSHLSDPFRKPSLSPRDRDVAPQTLD